MNNKYKLLVVEDDAGILSFMQTVLEMNNYQTVTAKTCSQGEIMFRSHFPDLVLLDLGLPDCDGLQLISEIRKTDATPIIVISARDSEQDKVAALDAGANDYITKPFGTEEALARIRATLRSCRHGNTSGVLTGGTFTLNGMVIDYDSRNISVDGERIKFTQIEYNILALFSEHVGQVMTYATIIRQIWGEAAPGSIKKLQVNMANIRKKLGLKTGEQRFFSNELGIGYRMLDAE